jgi:ADP-ribose pyrophosphatase YjhB (NUDIX family)/predicted pyridoxine 5'-phosphate oxidase superfamily flavin-nucleotide-binding protein
MGILSDEMQRLVREQRLGFYATVSDDGSPNLSPKGTTFVLDDDHLFFADVRSPDTVANIRRGSQMEVNIVDPLARKGYRFTGAAELYEPGSSRYLECVELMREAGSTLVERVKTIVVVEVREARPLVSPVYDGGRVTEEEIVRIYSERYAGRRGAAPDIPRIPASAGALVYDSGGRLLILKPSYKKGWTIPGGQIEPGESPWDGCRRETREECGLTLEQGRLVCVDFRPAKQTRPGGMRFLFDCGRFGDAELAGIRLQEDEIEEHRFAALDQAVELLSGPIGRRVEAAAGREDCIYLEDGRRVDGVT